MQNSQFKKLQGGYGGRGADMHTPQACPLFEYYPHQRDAIATAVDADFASAIFCHATGTGKTVTTLGIIEEFNKVYPDDNVMWFCERKSVLQEQRRFIRERMPTVNDRFIVVEYVTNKDQEWCQKLKLLRQWGRPLLVLINRGFLTSKTRYTELQIPFKLVIHDECHSACADETHHFLQHMRGQGANILGFSATPLKWSQGQLDRIYSLFDKRIISQFHFKQAVQQGVIVAPKLVSLDTKGNDGFDRNRLASWMPILDNLWSQLPYRKTVVWCGTVKNCIDKATEFEQLKIGYARLRDLSISVDTSKANPKHLDGTLSYRDFYQLKTAGILFCAMRHREGSDIPNLDSCIFLDDVRDRTDTSFIQSVGRVLRRDPKGLKRFGLILDASARDFYYYHRYFNRYIIDMEQAAMHLNDPDAEQPVLPDINMYQSPETSFDVEVTSGGKVRVTATTLDFQQLKRSSAEQFSQLQQKTVSDLRQHFVRKVPDKRIYHRRLDFELKIIEDNSYIYYLFQVVEILNLIGHVPHIIRGSCGSSLVCYLLGITNIDPVKYGIKFVRFLNSQRPTMPDIDIDFPYNEREKVFRILEQQWPGQVARISNHVHYKDRSSVREAIRRLGYRQQIAADELHLFIKRLSPEQRDQLDEHISEIEGTFRCYSLHCGGIVIFEQGVPLDIVHRSRTANQIVYDKRDVQEYQLFKIDILSNRGLAVLLALDQRPVEDYRFDAKIARLFSSGNNFGLTFAESPTMRKCLAAFKPKSLLDLAFCLAVVRPAASKQQKQCLDDANSMGSDNIDRLVYDDDAIQFIETYAKCNGEEADLIRRAFAKSDRDVIAEFEQQIQHRLGRAKADKIIEQLRMLKRYGFCKSHAVSYAQLVLGLAYQKVYNTRQFWLAALNHTQSSYRKWVYFREARLAGWQLSTGTRPWHTDGDRLTGSTSKGVRRRNTLATKPMGSVAQLLKYGFWTSKYFLQEMYVYTPDRLHVKFRGLIATGRIYRRNNSNTTFITIGYNDGCYAELVIRGIRSWSSYHVCSGEGLIRSKNNYQYIEVKSVNFQKLSV